MDDLELLEAWRGGSESAGNRLVQRHFRQVYLFFCNKINASEVDDLTQRTFLRCVEAKNAFRGDSSFKVYLLAIARNELLQHLRSQSRKPRVLDFQEVSVAALGTTPSAFVVREREQRVVLEALRQIPVNYQTAMELYLWEDLTGSEIADVLGVPEGTARTWIRRGKAAIRDQLQRMKAGDVDVESSDESLRAWISAAKPEE